jgi:ABC-type branched-subunit amino acid transport system ATPase component
MADPALELDGLEVRYGSVPAVRGLTLRLDEGEIVGLIGPNGAGKSTTLHAIMGAVPAHAGEIRLQGRSIRKRSPEAIAHAGVALVPEGRRIFSEFTVEENLKLGQAAGRGRRSGGLILAYDLFPMLKEYRRRQAGVLSGGQQQQLAIGRALVAEPEVLLLDEPSLGLAPRVINDLFAALDRLRAEQATILLVDQMAGLALALADRAYVIEGGRIVASGAASEIAAAGALEKAYLAVN